MYLEMPDTDGRFESFEPVFQHCCLQHALKISASSHFQDFVVRPSFHDSKCALNIAASGRFEPRCIPVLTRDRPP